MDTLLDELKIQTDLQQTLESVTLSFYHSSSSIKTDFGSLTPTLVDDLPGTIVQL